MNPDSVSPYRAESIKTMDPDHLANTIALYFKRRKGNLHCSITKQRMIDCVKELELRFVNAPKPKPILTPTLSAKELALQIVANSK